MLWKLASNEQQPADTQTVKINHLKAVITKTSQILLLTPLPFLSAFAALSKEFKNKSNIHNNFAKKQVDDIAHYFALKMYILSKNRCRHNGT